MATTTQSRPEGHIRKQPFQPSITSYFNTHNGVHLQSSRPSTPLSPPLPADTQASLLSVGMRVRKSVPEGYKTHKTLGGPGFGVTSSAPAVQNVSMGNGSMQRNLGGGVKGELMPFCGLHKTGGWAQQEAPSSSAPAAMQRNFFGEEDMDVPGLIASSQSTISSTQSSVAQSANRKRTYEEDAEEEMDAYFLELEAEDSAEGQIARNDRPIAKMKQSGKARGGPVRVVGEDDFEEASFLAPIDGMDVDGV